MTEEINKKEVEVIFKEMYTKLDIKNLPSDEIEKRAALLKNAQNIIMALSLEFLNGEYNEKQLFKKCREFINACFLDVPKSDFDNIVKAWFFPWREASWELDQAFNTMLLSMYKTTYDHLRRALEVAVVGIYFELDNTPQEEAQAWLKSSERTPFFTPTVKRISKQKNFIILERKFNWSSIIQKLYWELSDVTHIKGKRHSFDFVQPSRLHIEGMWIPEYNAESLRQLIVLYIEVTRIIATSVATANPMLLAGLNLEMKFGCNGPISGFLNSWQANLLRELLWDGSGEVIDEIFQVSSEVQDFKKWYDETPDITEEEFIKQANNYIESYALKIIGNTPINHIEVEGDQALIRLDPLT